MSMCSCSSPASEIGQAISDSVTEWLVNPRAFRNQQLRGGGALAEFEMLLAERTGFPFCLATSNATTALLVTALAAGLAGKRVIVPPNSWGGTYGPFEFARAMLERAEADGNGNICPKSVSRLLAPETAAVIAVDWKGVRHNAAVIRATCNDTACLYIEDTSWLPGVTGPDTARSLADIQVISFGPGKPLSLGEGGALLTRDEDIYRRAVALSQHPERSLSEEIEEIPEHPFLNARMHPLAAVMGTALLRSGGLREVSHELYL